MAEFFKSSSWSPVVVCALCVAFAWLFRVRKWKLPWKWFSLLLIIGLSLAAAAYLVLPVLTEDGETDIAAITALLMRGLPVYPAPDAAARYILLYGPLTFLFHVPFYFLFGANLLSFKLLGFLAFVLTLIALYGICRHYAAPILSLIGCACACVVLLRYVPIPFWGRIDPLLLALVALAYWLALRAPTPVVVVTTALALGIVPNLKFTAVLYLAPLLLFIWMQRGRTPTILTALLGALLIPIPFLLPVVSFSNYLFILHVVGRHGLDAKILLRTFQYVPIMLAPVLFLYFSSVTRADPQRQQKTLYLVVIAACMLISSFFGAKPGSGSYHLLPYIVPILHLYFWLRASSPEPQPDLPFARYAAAWVAVMLIFSAGQVRILVNCLRDSPRAAQVKLQITEAEAKYRGRMLAVGAGDNFTDLRTVYAFLPVLQGQPYVLNYASIRDLQFGGVALPQSTLQYFADCGTPVWLIPAGQDPFSALDTYYREPHPAFNDAFRNTFLSNYQRVASGPQYDTWVCKH
jgi:hypothetical protein